MHPKLSAAIENAITAILEYESDTFSASEFEVDREKAEQMLALLISHFLFDEEQFPGEQIDGAVMGAMLDSVTEEED